MIEPYFETLFDQLNQRAARATIADRTPSLEALREYLRHQFELEGGKPGSFLGQPILEALFEYESQPHPLANLDFLHVKTIELLDSRQRSIGIGVSQNRCVRTNTRLPHGNHSKQNPADRPLSVPHG